MAVSLDTLMTANIHATCIRIARAGKVFGAPASAGVLILGESGAGKSDLALRLIGRGAELVADDRTELDASARPPRGARTKTHRRTSRSSRSRYRKAAARRTRRHFACGGVVGYRPAHARAAALSAAKTARAAAPRLAVAHPYRRTRGSGSGQNTGRSNGIFAPPPARIGVKPHYRARAFAGNVWHRRISHRRGCRAPFLHANSCYISPPQGIPHDRHRSGYAWPSRPGIHFRDGAHGRPANPSARRLHRAGGRYRATPARDRGGGEVRRS